MQLKTSSTWYQTPFFIAVFSFFFGFMGTQISTSLTKWRESRETAENLKIAFEAEIQEIRNSLRRPTHTIARALEQGNPMILQPVVGQNWIL